MKTSTMLIILGLIILAVIFFSRSLAISAEEEDTPQVYEADLEGVLGPGDARALETKKKEAYLANLYLRTPEEPYISIGEDYQVYVGTTGAWGMEVVVMEILYYNPESTMFVYELRGRNEGVNYIETEGLFGGTKKRSWDNELYEQHLDKAYRVALEQYPDVYQPHPFVGWYIMGQKSDF